MRCTFTGVGTRSSTPERLREDLRTTRGDTERTAATPDLDETRHLSFQSISGDFMNGVSSVVC